MLDKLDVSDIGTLAVNLVTNCVVKGSEQAERLEQPAEVFVDKAFLLASLLRIILTCIVIVETPISGTVGLVFLAALCQLLLDLIYAEVLLD